MAIKFRKREKKISSGIYVNLSKSGIGAAIGPKGADSNIYKEDVYLNTGIA